MRRNGAEEKVGWSGSSMRLFGVVDADVRLLSRVGDGIQLVVGVVENSA